LNEHDYAEKRGGRTQAPAQSGWAAWYAGRDADERDRAVQSAPPIERKAPEEPPPPARAPVVRVRRIVTPRGAQLLVVERCPFCGKKHAHGAVSERFGAGDGPRVSHCLAAAARSYVLREARTNTNAGAKK
jgi:hypothetical protein